MRSHNGRISLTSNPSRRRLVFWLRPKAGEKYLVFIPENEAKRLAQIHGAIESSNLWGEFRKRMPSKELKEVVGSLLDQEEPLPKDTDPFDVEMLPGFTEGDWLDWPEQKMMRWLPRDIWSKFGRIESSVLNGPFLVLDLQRLSEILAALSQAGFDCILDEKLVLRACGDQGLAAETGS
jgi:hypothetical protein